MNNGVLRGNWKGDYMPCFFSRNEIIPRPVIRPRWDLVSLTSVVYKIRLWYTFLEFYAEVVLCVVRNC